MSGGRAAGPAQGMGRKLLQEQLHLSRAGLGKGEMRQRHSWGTMAVPGEASPEGKTTNRAILPGKMGTTGTAEGIKSHPPFSVWADPCLAQRGELGKLELQQLSRDMTVANGRAWLRGSK